MVSVSASSPQSLDDARFEFIAMLEGVLRKKGRRDQLTLVLGGFADLARLRMIEKWWMRAATDPVSQGIFGVNLSGADGWERLDAVRKRLDMWLTSVAGRRSPLDWSCILRRIRYELYKRLPLVTEAILNLSQVYTEESPVKDTWWRFKTQGWLSGASVLTDLDDLISLAVMQQNVITCQRRISKGQSLVLGKPFAPVDVTSDPIIESAIRLYDVRNWMAAGGTVGNATGSMGADVATHDSSDVIITWMDIRGHKLLRPTDEARLLRDHDPIFPLGIDASTLAPAAVFPESITKETVALGMVLEAAWQWLILKGAHFATKRGVWTRLGYLDCSRHWFLRELPKHQTPIAGVNMALDAEEVVALLKPSGLSVVYPLGSRIVIDLLRASHLLDGTIFRASEGANAWGSAFEVAVQRIIDTTPWRPSDEFRPLIGHVIRRGQDAITDIDAVALTDSTLLLIDAKAFRVSPALAVGEYSATRTMQEKVESASIRWRDIVSLVRSNPQILGVPIPEGVDIDGLVVLPFVPYVPIGPATQPVLKLLRASSIAELMLVAVHDGQPPTSTYSDAKPD
jgi:hypothetical protein